MVIKMSDTQTSSGILEDMLEKMKFFNIGVFSREERLKRIETCVACDKFEPIKMECGVCKCSIAPMVLMHSKSCLEGKWISDDPDDPSEGVQNIYHGD